jgi:hypothetical protein
VIEHYSSRDEVLLFLDKCKLIFADMQNTNTPLAMMPCEHLKLGPDTNALILQWNSVNNWYASLIVYQDKVFGVLRNGDFTEYRPFIDMLRESLDFNALNIKLG